VAEKSIQMPGWASRQPARLLSQDWKLLYGHPIYFLQTFIDPDRFRGTCYRAAKRLGNFRHIPRQSIAHLNGGRRPRRSLLQHLGEVLAGVLAPGEKQRNPALLDQPIGEHSGSLRGVVRIRRERHSKMAGKTGS
jgi:hypothetical protein